MVLRQGILIGMFGAVVAVAQAPRAVEHKLPDLERSLYFVLPPRTPPKAGKGGLLVVLPGGDGSREFLPWVEKLVAQAPADCTGVLVTAVKWRDDQKIIWPLERSQVAGARYTTGDYVRGVIAAVEKQVPVDPERRAIVAWSSSGPAAYPLLCAKDGPFRRGYVAMSIWPKDLDAKPAKGRRFLLDQSPDDEVTTFDHVRRAYDALHGAGAVVRLSTYAGGHGWQDDPLARFESGLRWLLSEEPAPPPAWPATKSAGAVGTNLVQNGGFEEDTKGWRVLDNSSRLVAKASKDEKHAGKQSLHLQKQGGPPLDLVVQEVALPAGSKVMASAAVRSKGAKNAWIKVWLYGDGEEPLNETPNLLRIAGDLEWQVVSAGWEHKGAKRAVVQCIMVGAGDVWLDEVTVTVAK